MLRRLLDSIRLRFGLRRRRITCATPNRPRLAFRVKQRDGFLFVEPRAWR